MKILQVSTRDTTGGAERSARNLADAYRAMGHQSWLAVGSRRTSDPNIFVIPNDDSRNGLARRIDRFRARNEPSIGRLRGAGRLTTIARTLAEPARFLAREAGREDFDFPGTSELLNLPPSRPDVLHLHNLHGGYFDLRTLPNLTHEVPTILNVHDGWLTSGHCAFSLGCDRWKTGCGNCPDLTLYPSVKRDATAFNWERKRTILADSRFYLCTPSQWMMDRALESIIAPGAINTRIIPNSVDLSTFRPGDRSAARAAAGIDGNDLVLLVAANGLRSNVWKDYVTLRKAIEILGSRSWPKRIVVIAVGEAAPTEQVGTVELRFTAFENESERLADYYRAADVYLHAARVESFGNVLLEARACGTPIVATSVGGIPEQVRALGPFPPEEASGILVREADPDAFAAAVTSLLLNPDLRQSLSIAGLRHVTEEFSVEHQALRFVRWYEEILHA